MGSEIEILDVKIQNCDFDDLMKSVSQSLDEGKKLLISYANANTLNLTAGNSEFRRMLNNKFLLHPDGAGVYMASGYLNNKLKSRFTGSDFYPTLAEWLTRSKKSVFFFGHSAATLDKINRTYPGLNICGSSPGYNYDSHSLINQINSLKPDVLIVGLGQPQQEEWIVKYADSIETKLVIAVGDGIKVFAGEKRRGPRFLRKLGLEWTWRLLFNPIRYWKRYLLGNPLFLYRIIRAKYVKLSN